MGCGKVGETSQSPLTLLGIASFSLGTKLCTRRSWVRQKGHVCLGKLSSSSIILLLLVSSEETVKTSLGLFVLFLVSIHRNLQAVWVLMSRIAMSSEWMFTPVVRSLTVVR